MINKIINKFTNSFTDTIFYKKDSELEYQIIFGWCNYYIIYLSFISIEF